MPITDEMLDALTVQELGKLALEVTARVIRVVQRGGEWIQCHRCEARNFLAPPAERSLGWIRCTNCDEALAEVRDVASMADQELDMIGADVPCSACGKATFVTLRMAQVDGPIRCGCGEQIAVARDRVVIPTIDPPAPPTGWPPEAH
jgi:hypothetical protein